MKVKNCIEVKLNVTTTSSSFENKEVVTDEANLYCTFRNLRDPSVINVYGFCLKKEEIADMQQKLLKLVAEILSFKREELERMNKQLLIRLF